MSRNVIVRLLAVFGYGCPPHPAIVIRPDGAYCTECGQRVY